ncbi:MAG: hypothetical protein KGO96_12635 [Elusimicrobia bacterium]|nr:hypothetical protein [Elusimicrobiota bacterium]
MASVDQSPGEIGNFAGNPILWYNVGVWGQLGFAVPNPGQRQVSANSTILDLVSIIGRNLQAIMVHDDASLRRPPSINTLIRVHKLCMRVRQIIGGRAVPAGTPNMEPAHNVPDTEPFRVFPAPFFQVRNGWMREYAQLAFGAISEAMQHTDNGQPFEIGVAFAGLLGQYFQRIYRLMSTELFGISVAMASDPAFVLTDAQIAAYDPTKWFTQTELIDTVPALGNQPSAYDLQPLSEGIIVSQLPALQPYPFGASAVAATSAPAAPTTTAAPSVPPFPAAPTP